MTAPSPPTGIHHPFSTNRARSVVAICAVFMFVATFAVVLRFWSRRIKRTALALDDWLVVSGLIFYYFSAIQTILQVCIGGLGHHVNEGVTPEELVITGKVGQAYRISAKPLSSSEKGIRLTVRCSWGRMANMPMRSAWDPFGGLLLPSSTVSSSLNLSVVQVKTSLCRLPLKMAKPTVIHTDLLSLFSPYRQCL